MNIKSFESLLRMTQKQLKKHLAKEMRKRGREVIVDDGYIYSPGELPIILCAHLDTVHENKPSVIVYSKGEISSPQGIGGDDRCGVWMIMEIIKKVNPTVIFFEDEECGGVGSMLFSKTKLCDDLIGKINYVIELDRKGENDAVFYDCENYDFADFVTKSFWKESFGTFTDICNICPALGCAGVNLSCGYYKQHTKDEYIVISEMEKAMCETIKMINRGTNVFYEYVEAKKFWDKLDWRDNYGYGYYGGYKCDSVSYESEYTIVFINDEGSEEEYYTKAVSEWEAIGLFCTDFPNKRYMDIVEIF